MQATRVRTLKELAERLGVSVTTVSRALAGHEQIARKTRERVSQAAREMGYVPNIAGRQLVSGRSNFVGFIIPLRGPNFMDSYLGEFVTGLGEGLVSHGIDLILATVQQGQSELDVLRHLVESGRADGVVIPRIAAHDARVRRLWWFALMGALLAGLYIGALAWVTQEVEAGVERSIQPLPLMLRDRPDTD